MIDRIGIRTRQLEKLAAFYSAALAPLGYTGVMSYERGVGYGRDGGPSFWIGASDGATSSVHVAFVGPDRKAVDAFYASALANGGEDGGSAGVRDYSPSYYAAFVVDPDGNNIEVVCRSAR